MRRERGLVTERGGGGTLLLQEAIPETPAEARTTEQWASIGRELAKLHHVYGDSFGLAAFDGFFGPLPQDNRTAADWPSFYGSRRLAPLLRRAVDTGRLGPDLAAKVERVIDRLALLDYFAPVPPIVFDAYREVTPIDATFGDRRELWRLFGYLAVVTVDGDSPFGRPFIGRIAAAVERYGRSRRNGARKRQGA
ncbi:fructosamine kinase family protein [Actinoplanes sp. NPDC051513]|uniref:fructosamine kinase family protein n=1 Tax=Actinoplanes sp. NPDC051513 TaxID=3363908 RepID=UPI003790A605